MDNTKHNCWAPPEHEIESDDSVRRIARVIEALRVDYERQGFLADDQVVRAVHKRKIASEGYLRVRQALADAGIAVEDSASDTGAVHPDAPVETIDEDAARPYLDEIGRCLRLSPEEEVSLARRVQVGREALASLTRADLDESERAELLNLHRIGSEARQQMILANLRLVVGIARRCSKTLSLDILDLIQEGTLGLMRAVERFDYQRGYKFSTYSIWWIFQGISRGIANNDRLIRLPLHAVESLRKLQRLRRRLSDSMSGIEPSSRELAIRLGWTVEKVRLLLSVAEDASSIDAPVGGDTESSLAGLLKSPATLDPEQMMTNLEKARQTEAVVNELDSPAAEVVRLRFGLGTVEERTLQEIGDMRGVTRERIRQIEAKALKSLRRQARLRDLWYEAHMGRRCAAPAPQEENAKGALAAHHPRAREGAKNAAA